MPPETASLRRLISPLLAWLLVAQVFVAGVAAAQAVAATTHSDPICHGDAAGETSSGGAAAGAHSCCISCLSTVPMLAPPPTAPSAIGPSPTVPDLFWSEFELVVSAGAVRAGATRAPPAAA